MNALWLNAVAWIIFMVVIVVSCNWLWRRDAQRAVVEWCAANCVAMDDATLEFNMGRPAHASVVGTQGGERYLFVFTLHSGLLSLPKSLFRVWGKVVLRDRTQVH
jgi:hypothetical protein